MGKVIPPKPPSGGAAPPTIPQFPDTNESTSLTRYTYYNVGDGMPSGRRAKGKNAEEQQVQVGGYGTIIPVRYGRVRVGARIGARIIYNGDLIMLCVWGEGEIDAVEQVYIDDEVVANGVTITNYLGTQDQTADPTLVAAFAAQGKAYSDALPGIAYSVVSVSPRKTSGFPQVAAMIRGRKVRSTEGGSEAYSRVDAYIIADFITNTTYGLKKNVNWTDVAALAVRNNESVGTPSEERNVLDVSIDRLQLAQAWLLALCTYAGCVPVLEGNTYRLFLDAPAASSGTLTAANIVSGSLTWEKASPSDTPTVVEVVYTKNDVIPARDASAFVYAEGVQTGATERRVQRISMPGITRYSEAYRYGVHLLNLYATSDLVITFVTFDEGLKYQPGDRLTLTVGPFTSKEVRILSVDPISAQLHRITCKEYDEAAWSDVVVSGPTTMDTSLPSVLSPPTVTGFTAVEEIYQTQTGIFASRIVMAWTYPTTSDYLYLEGFVITITQGSNETKYLLPYEASSFVTGPLAENQTYECQIRARSEFAESTTSAVEFVSTVGKQAVPGDVPSVTAYSVNGETRVSWEAATDLDLTGYELRWSAQSGTWEAATHLAFVAAPALAFATTLIPAGDRRVWIKALDSVRTEAYPNGQESASAASYDFTATSSSVSNTDEHAPGSVTLTNMVAYEGGYVTSVSGDTFSALFAGALSTYTNALATYHASGTSGLVTDTVDLGTAAATVADITIQWTDLSGTGQPYIEHKVNSGDSWTRVNGLTASVNARYFRWGIEATTTETIYVTDVGVLRATRDATDDFVQQSDVLLWMGV